jgi:hypothetical protein
MTDPQTPEAQPPEESPRPSPLRLLPWTTPEGKPVYLSGEGGFLSQMADAIEDFHLSTARQLLELAPTILDNPQSGREELRFTARELAACLDAVLKATVSRRLAFGCRAYGVE